MRLAWRRLASRRRWTLAFVGLVGPAGPIHPQRGREPLAQPLEREVAVARLGPLVGGHHPHLVTEPLEEPGPLARPERRRAGDVEAHLDARVGGVGVLATGAAAAAEPPRQLRRGDHERRRHPHPARIIGHAASVRSAAMPDDDRTRAEWIAAFAARLGVEPPDEDTVTAAARPRRA